MHAVALANTPACNSHRTGMRWPSYPIAFFWAVVLHLPSQYIFICLCSISALPLAVLLFKETDIMQKYYRTAIVVYINTDAVRYRMLYLLLLFFIPYLRHGECCLFTIVPAIGMAGYQCLMPVASFIYWNIVYWHILIWTVGQWHADDADTMDDREKNLLTLMFFCLISKLIAHNICILIFV